MPSKTPKQAKFMRAIAHGWTPSRMKSPPSRAVAQEFVDADRKYSGGFAENRYWTGGLAAMDEAHAGYKRGSLDFKWQEGGDVDYEENGMRRGGRTRRNGGGSGGLGGLTESPYTYEEQVKRDAFLNMDIQPNGVFSTMLHRIQQRNLPPPEPTIAATSGTSVTGPSGSDVTVYSGPRIAGRGGGRRGGRRGGGRRNGGGGSRPPGSGGGGGATPPRITETDPASYIAAAAAPEGRESPYRDELRAHQAQIAATLGSARGGHVNNYEEGGAVRPAHAEDTGERGANPWDPEKDAASYKYWETRYHKDPVTPEEMVEEGEEIPEPGFLERWFGIRPMEPSNVADIEEKMKALEEARGGYVGYQAGGRVMPPPVGGVPPWIEPAGSGPGFMEPEPEPQGYQFGGRSRSGGYRGVPPQRGGFQRGAPPGGDRGFLSRRFGRQAQAQRGAPQGALAQMYGRAQQQQAGAQPQGGVWRRMFDQAQQQQAGGAQPGGGIAARMRQAQQAQQAQAGGGGGGILARIRQAQQQQQAQAGGLPPGFRDPMAGGRGGQYGYEGDPSQPGYDDRSYEDFVAQQRQQGNVSGLPGITDEVLRSRYEGRNANQGAIYTSGPGAPGGGVMGPGRVQAGGGMYTDPRHPAYTPPGSGGSFDMSGRYTPPTTGFLAGHDPTGGKRFPGSRIAPPPGPGPGGIQGGPRVPPNMRGFLQKQRMMNRPPTNVGGAQAQRVGMQDQQGALARAMQKGAGRAPMSRRMGFGRAGPTR